MTATKIPFLDLVTPHQELKTELLQVVEKALQTAGFIGGPMVEDFEREFSHFSGAKYCVGVNSGTDALRFAFMAAPDQPWEMGISLPYTFMAAAGTISLARAHISFPANYES